MHITGYIWREETIDKLGRALIITAREMTKKERRRYAKK